MYDPLLKDPLATVVQIDGLGERSSAWDGGPDLGRRAGAVSPAIGRGLPLLEEPMGVNPIHRVVPITVEDDQGDGFAG